MVKKFFIYLIIFIFCISLELFGDDLSKVGDELKQAEEKLDKIEKRIKNNVSGAGVSGSVRFWGEDRGYSMKSNNYESIDIMPTHDPALSLRITGTVFPMITLQGALGLSTKLDEINSKDFFFYNDILLMATTEWDKMGINLSMGSILWTRLTYLTFWGEGREEMIFNRLPWEEHIVPSRKYFDALMKGAEGISDTRWGKRALQGISLGVDLNGIDIKILYGKPETVNGTSLYENIGGMEGGSIILKDVIDGNLRFGYSHRYIKDKSKDFYNSENEVYAIGITEKFFDIVNIDSEISHSKYIDNSKTLVWYDSGYYIKIEPYIFADLKILLDYYNFGKEYYSDGGAVIDTFFTRYNTISEKRLYYNNRTGLNLNLSYSLNNIMNFNLVYGFACNNSDTTNIIVIPHRMNHYVWFAMIERDSNFSYNGDLVSSYGLNNEGAYEKIYLAKNVNVKKYNLIDFKVSCDLNETFNLNIKNFLLGFNIKMNNIVDKSAFLPFGDSLISGNYLLLFAAKQVVSEFYTIAFFGREAYYSDKSVNKIDMSDIGYGIGLDYDFSHASSVFLRYRIFKHNDEIVGYNNFDGSTLSLEYKIFF